MNEAKPMPAKLEIEMVAEATSASTGGRRQVWKNEEFGVTLVVTWAPPHMDIGLQSFSCKALPYWTFNNYEAMRKTYAEQVLNK